MNILVILGKSDNYSELINKHDILIENLKEWFKNGNDIIVLTHTSKDFLGDTNFKIINPPGYVSNKLLLSLWFFMVNHPSFDVILDEISLAPFIYKKVAKVLYFPRNQKIPGKPFINILSKYNNEAFVVSDAYQFTQLIKLKVKKPVFLLQKELTPGIRNLNNKKSVSKNLIFVLNGDNFKYMDDALNIFKEIERREIGWKYRIFVNIRLLEKTKAVFNQSEIEKANYQIKIFTKKSIIKELRKPCIFLDTEVDELSMQNDTLAILLNKPIVAGKINISENNHGLQKLFIYPADETYREIAKKIVEIENHPEMLSKIFKNTGNFIKENSQQNLSKKSIGFLESLRPE